MKGKKHLIQSKGKGAQSNCIFMLTIQGSSTKVVQQVTLDVLRKLLNFS